MISRSKNFIGYRSRTAWPALFGAVLGIAGVWALSTPAQAVTPERSLAGIKIFSPISVVVKKFGSPDEIRVGASSTNPNGGGGAPFDTGAGAGAYGGSPTAGMGGPYGPGGMPPWMQGQGGDNSGGDTTTPSQGLVTYIYDQNDSGTLEFTFSSDGHVIQIKATGYKGNVRTVKGITLGMSVADVITRYGQPDTSAITSNILTMNYNKLFHATFQVYNKRVVAIAVAAVE